jgi:hypothetical protein
MIVTVTEFAQLARDLNGHLLPLGTNRIACQELTAAGAFEALQSATHFVRVASDTGLRVYVDGGYYGFFPPGGVEFKAMEGGTASPRPLISFTAAA